MQSGVIGPVPFLHWFIWSDGETSYKLTEYEMFIHVLFVVNLARILSAKKSWRKGK